MSERDKGVHEKKNQMSSNVLKVRYKQELGSLRLEDDNDHNVDRRGLAIWLFEWYESRGRRLPYGMDEQRPNKISEEELDFLYRVLRELPVDFPMIRYSALWSKWLFPNISVRSSGREYYNTWLGIMKIMEERFPNVYVNDIDPLVGLVTDDLQSSSPPDFELCYVGLKLLGKLITMYIPPRKGFCIVTGGFLGVLRSFYTREDLYGTFAPEIKREITRLVQVSVNEKHLPSFLPILRSEVSSITGRSPKKTSYTNYTFDLYKILVKKNSEFDCFLPLIIEKIHEIERSDQRESQTRSTIGGDYLLFFLYLSLNLEDSQSFFQHVKYVNECFAFFIRVNTFNIRESEDEFGNNFKLRIYELILRKLQECISERALDQNVWKIIESSILIDPIKCLELLPSLLPHHGKSSVPKYARSTHKPSLYDPLNIMLDFISSEDLSPQEQSALVQSENSVSSLETCLSKYILTFIKLHDLSLFFSNLSEVFSRLDNSSKNLHRYEHVFLSTEVLQTIRDSIGLSVLPGQASDIINSFLGFLKMNKSGSLLHECVAVSWTGILLITIPLSEPSIPALKKAVDQIHQYILDYDSEKAVSKGSKALQTTCTVGLIHLLRKLSSWHTELRDELSEMLNYHYNKVLAQDPEALRPEEDSSSLPSDIYDALVHLIVLITRLRDLGSLEIEDFVKIFMLYGRILNDSLELSQDDFLWRIRVNKILIRFILTNISYLEGTKKCLESYIRDEEKFPNFSSFLKSLFELFLQTSNVPSPIFRSLVQTPYLPGLMVDMALEMVKNNTINDKRKKRKLSHNHGSRDLDSLVSHTFRILDFWNQKKVVMFFVNNRTKLLTQDKVFSKISRLYLTLVFELDSILSSEQEQYSLISSIEKAAEGIMTWIIIEEEVGASDFVQELSQVLFAQEGVEEKRRLVRLLDLISRAEANSELSQNLNSVLISSVRSFSGSEKNPRKIGSLVIKQMDSLDWWWWIDVRKDFEDLLGKKKSWINQIQLCIDLSSEKSFKGIKKRILGKVDIFQILAGLEDKLREDKKTELLYLAKICELYLGIHPEIQDWDPGSGSKDHETQESKSLLGANKAIKALGVVLDRVKRVLLDPKMTRKLLKECFILVDLVVKCLRQVVRVIDHTMSSLKKSQTHMELLFELLKEVYSGTFGLILELIRVNLEFGIYNTTVQDNHDKTEPGSNYKSISTWSRQFMKSVLEGSSMNKEDYKYSPHAYRQMEIYEMISSLVNSSVGSILNHVINQSIIQVKFARESLFVVLSHLDLFWGIIRNKGIIYRLLSYCLKGNLFSKISSWGASDKLEFVIEIMISKFIDFLENKESNMRREYILCTFSLIRLSNIISILYSCCVKCYIFEIKENERTSLSNSRIVTISNMLLVISSKLSGIGLGLRFDNLEVISKEENFDKNTRESFYQALFECLMVSPYIPLYTLINPIWDQSNRKKNKNQRSTGHLDVWISQFHLVEESLKNLLSLGEHISLHTMGLKLYAVHNKRISRLYPLIVSLITKDKVQRYSISLVCDLINHINILNKRLELVDDDDEVREAINLNIKVIKNSCLDPVLSVIDSHCKQSLFTMLKDEQRIIFKQIVKSNSETLSFQ